MFRKYFLWAFAFSMSCGVAGASGTLGKVVSIGGAAADLALDEARGYLYIANFTANRIEQMSLSSKTIQTSINVASQPSSLSLSPDGRYLLVAHYGNYASTPSNALTVIDLTSGARQTFALGNPPLGVAFGSDGRALVATSAEFILFDPVSGSTQVLNTVTGLQANTLPSSQSGTSFPSSIVAASIGVSGDGTKMYGLTDVFEFSYDVNLQNLNIVKYVSTPTMGPRVVSVNKDGTYYASGWALNDRFGHLVAEFPSPTGSLSIGSHVFDSSRGLLYAQVPTSATGVPILQILDSDNLNVREQYYLPENLSGRSVLSSDTNTMYAVSDSGVLILPVGNLNSVPRVVAGQEDVLFTLNSCNSQVVTQQIMITDPGGGNTPFALSNSASGITVSPSSGITPASVQITVDPSAFLNQKGTVVATVTLSSATGVTVPPSFRVLVNLKDPDQRGTVVNVPGTLVDVLADPARSRFYVLRQDKNQVLVFNGTNNTQITTLRTSNVPTQMAITYDRRYLLIGSNDSQIIPVYDLETFEQMPPIIMPFGHYPRSVAVAANAILAACRVAGPTHMIDRVDFNSRTATVLASLGVYKNDVNINTNLVGSPNGSTILGVSADGTVLLYDSNVSSFTVVRKDYTSLSGAYAASSFSQYVAGNHLLNSSLVSIDQLETSTGNSSGFAFVDKSGLRSTAPSTSGTGVVQRVDTTTGVGLNPTRMAEPPLLGNTSYAFTRTLAPLYDRSEIINLTTSGFTVLPWAYDTSVAPPKIAAVVNAADGSASVAPGSLISLYGTNMSPVNIATKEIPLPTALGDSCLAVNGMPIPLIFTSPTQMNAQLPYQAIGNVTLIVRTPGGISDNYNLVIQSTAPGVFQAVIEGYNTPVPTVIRADNQIIATTSNPVHRGDVLTIYLTGLGQTSPAVSAGLAAPSNPLATAVVTPSVSLGGTELPVSYAGLSPGEVGVYQINVTVPRNAPTGLTVPLRIVQGSGTTSVAVRVVD